MKITNIVLFIILLTITFPSVGQGIGGYRADSTIKFKEMMFDFGDIEQGQEVQHVFEFVNYSNTPFQIDSSRTTCGCTVAEFDKTPVPVGGKGGVPVKYNSKDKMGIQDKSIILFTNKGMFRLRIRMNVLPNKEK